MVTPLRTSHPSGSRLGRLAAAGPCLRWQPQKTLCSPSRPIHAAGRVGRTGPWLRTGAIQPLVAHGAGATNSFFSRLSFDQIQGGIVTLNAGQASLTYDAAGNLKTRTDSRGVLDTYTYDALNRLTGVVYSKKIGFTSLAYTWVYDYGGIGYLNGIGQLAQTTHPAGLTRYTYDPQGRVLTDTQQVNPAAGANTAQINETVTYTYDAAGHVTSIVYPSGRKLSVTYVSGQPTALSLAKDTATPATPLISAIQWEPFGAAKSWQWQMASGPQGYNRVHDIHGRLVRYQLGDTIRDLTYDAGDRISAYTHYAVATAAATPVYDQRFGYDELGRLTGITAAAASWAISYDANGNRTSVALNGAPRGYTTATTSNRLLALTNPARSFGYDNAGNTISDSGGSTSTYDLSARMATLAKAGVTTTYSVDSMGRRVRKFASSGAASTVIFIYDQSGQLLGEYDNTGKAIREFVWLGDIPVAVFTPDPAGALLPPIVYYVHADHLNTPRVVVDRSGNRRWRWIAEPFGVTAAETNPDGLGNFTFNLRFPGQYFDQESGLHYNYFRDYDPSVGRFTQPDPLGLAGGDLSLYAYVGGDPLSYIDPDGLMQIYEGNGVTFHSFPGGPAGGIEHARQGPGQSYHIHLRDGSGNEARISTETWKPLTPDDKKIFDGSKPMQKACEGLTDGEKKFFDRVNRQVFHRGGPSVNQLMRMGNMRGGNRGPVGGGRGEP